VKTKKGFGVESFFSILEDVEKNKCDYYVHFRKATVGKVCAENTHPFDVLGNQKLYLMHNGTIPGFKIEENCQAEKSDTKLLSEELKAILYLQSNQKNYLLSKEFKSIVEQKIGNNRLVLISDQISIIFNEDLWVKSNGLKFSKKIEKK
jgi:predicted glutamine amidotransferase